MRIALGLEYHGAAYAGWQTQPQSAQVITLQNTLESALAVIANQLTPVVCCGRTDAGVHAVQQVVHFDTTAVRPLQAWVRGLNALLPKTLSVRWALLVDESFHARHSAIGRRYTYVLANTDVRPTLLHSQVGWVHRPLSLKVMQYAAKTLIGEHDFSTFRASECQARTPIRTITQLDIEQRGEFFLFHVQANAFLHHMIRNLVGSLVYVGIGKWSLEQFASAFAAKDRTHGAPTFAPDGLYFCGASYPQHYGISSPKQLPMFG
jgi:tRNA pseudouridine38-40 synthase